MVYMLYIWGDGKLSYTGIDGIHVVHLGGWEAVIHRNRWYKCCTSGGDGKLSYTGIGGIHVVHLGGWEAVIHRNRWYTCCTSGGMGSCHTQE